MENKPGNGYESPFGNGKGATSAGPSTGAANFVKDPKGPPAANTGRGLDVADQQRPQPMGGTGYNPDSLPEGGALPFPQTDVPADASTSTAAQPKRSFTLRGDGGGASPPPGGTSPSTGGGASPDPGPIGGMPRQDEDY